MKKGYLILFILFLGVLHLNLMLYDRVCACDAHLPSIYCFVVAFKTSLHKESRVATGQLAVARATQRE